MISKSKGRVRRSIALGAILVFALSLVAGCGGKDSPTQPSDPGSTPATIAVLAGNQQTVRVSSAVGTRPAVAVRDAEGKPCRGAIVTFTVNSGEGTIAGAVDTTGVDGVAMLGSWTLGSTPGRNSLVASVVGHPDIAASIEATARPPRWTFMVYMAADNTLAVQGILDIDEMESAGVDPEVQVVVEAEFSPTALAQAGCTDPACFNRPNFNTFRYFITGQGADVNGPNGAAAEGGNRNMADPSELADFVNWTKANFPAEHYCLVLWNHGGGYTGLLEDQTAGSLMSVGGLHAALAASAPIDVLDFDMCLMGGYETLASINGLASYAVFSEEVVPGEGNPYAAILDALQADSGVDGRALSQIIADKFHAFYQGNRASTTVSAFDLSGYTAFENALNTLAANMGDHLDVLSGPIGDAASATQHYTIPELKDLVDFLDLLAAKVTDAGLRSQISALKAQATGAFRLKSYHENGIGENEGDVSRSNGLTVVLPAGGTADRLSDDGPRSYGAYESLYPGKAWTLFLSKWLQRQTVAETFDQGNDRFESYLIWSTDAISLGVDIDMWILEPNGNLFIPYLGSVSPNGTFTNDSAYDEVSFEGYITNRFVQPGMYKIYANLYADPQNFRPQYNVAYRFEQDRDFSLIYPDTPPSLSKDNTWLDDETPTMEEIEGGAYSDLQYAAWANIVPSGSPALASRAAGRRSMEGADLAAAVQGRRLNAARERASGSATPMSSKLHPTARQLEAVRNAMKHRKQATRTSALHASVPGLPGLSGRGGR